MHRAIALGLLALAIACRASEPQKPGGARLHVLFDERHDLKGGEPVRFHDFEVGQVEAVDLAEARVRASLAINPEVLEQFTRETTFTVESGATGPFLLAHVLDPEAGKLEAGATVEGADSAVELTLREAGIGASKFLESVGSSKWVQDAKGLVSEMEQKVGEVDWGEKEQKVRDHLRETREGLDKAAGETADEAKKSYGALREQMKRIAEELESLGRSEEAQKLEEQIDKLFGGESKSN